MQAKRRILHIDMDCFYAACELRERPQLLHRPVAVGGASGRGVLTTCNYLAREFGVRSAMPVYQARKLCPELIILPVRFEVYRAVSTQVRDIFYRYTGLVEPLSLDEAYLDVSHLKQPGADIAQAIRSDIRRETGLSASAGVAPNKLIAKIASDWNKPDGQCVVSPSRVQEFIEPLPVRKIWGVGPKSAARFADLGIETCGQRSGARPGRARPPVRQLWSGAVPALSRDRRASGCPQPDPQEPELRTDFWQRLDQPRRL